MNILQRYINELKYWKFLYTSGGFYRIKDYLLQNVWFDLQNGTDTSGWLEPQNFEQKPANIQHGVRYRASYTKEVLQALDHVSKLINPADFSFVDIGCGKGKVLMLARMHVPFRQVTGVDYYAPFLETARRNFEAVGLSDQVTLIHSDASEFQDLPDQAVIYMYNPFDEFILKRVKDIIQKKCSRAVLIYNKPLHKNLFADWYAYRHSTGPSPDWETSIFLFAKERTGMQQPNVQTNKAA